MLKDIYVVLVELAGKVVNLKGDLFLCCDFCEESVVGNIKLPVLSLY